MTAPTTPAPAPGAPADQTEPSFDLTHEEIIKVFVGLMIGMLLAALDQTIVATALPTIVGDLGGVQHLSWVVTAYLLTSTIVVPLYGKLSDVYGRKRLFQVAIILFVAGSIASGASQTMAQLIAFRALQGAGAGGLATLAFTIIGDIVAPRERGRYQGYIGSVFAVASVAGPLIGGFFVDHLDWRWAFYVNVPLAVIALFVTERNLNLRHVPSRHRIDWTGAALLGVSLTSLILATTWGGREHAWTSPVIVGLGATFAVTLGLFVLVERRAAEPLLPLSLFRNDVFTVANAIGFTLGIGMFGAIVFLPVFLQVSTGVSATSSGLMMVPLMAGVLVASVVTGRLITAWGRYRAFPIAGSAIMVAGFALLGTMHANTGQAPASAYMLIVGIGMGMGLPVLVLAIQNAVEHRHMGIATSSAQLFRQVGGSLGVAAFGALFNSRLASALAETVPPELLTGAATPESLVNTPAAIAALEPGLRTTIQEAVASASTFVFRSAIPVALVAFALSWALREVRLRSAADPQPATDDVAMTESAIATIG